MGNSLVSSTVGSTSATTSTSSILPRILNVTIGQTHTKNALEDAIAADAIPMNLLIAMNAEWKDSHGKALSILRGTSGITSLISSSIFIWMILRSHERLSTTQHRLLLALCISDITFSLSFSTFNVHAPSDNNYITWNARGNQDSCTALGFLMMLGLNGGLFYNASLNLYFLAVVKYNKSNEFIRAKIEPFLHGIPIAVTLIRSITGLVKKHFNDDGSGNCISPINVAPHCIGYDVGEIREGFQIPCWRGIKGVWIAGILNVVGTSIPVLIIMVSLGMIYRSVRRLEKKLAKYGVGALRSNLQQQSVSTQQQRAVQDEQLSGIWGRLTMSLTALSASLRSRTWSCKKSNKPVTRSNASTQSQSHAIMQKAFGYTFAWFLSYGIWLIGLIVLFATGSFPLVLAYLNAIFGPLQGLFNLLIFMHPKIMAAKKSKKQGGETASFCQAFVTAFWSRGKGGKNQGTSTSNLRGGSNGRPKRIRNEDIMTEKTKGQTFGSRIKKRDKTHRDEEEKCEIQVPDNLNPNMTKAMYSAASTATYARNIVPSTKTTTMHTVNRTTDDTVGMKKVDFEENVNVGNTLSDVLEDPDEGVMLNQDEEEEMEEAREENVDIMSKAEDGPILVGVNEKKEISMENQVIDEMNADFDSELVSLSKTAVQGEQTEDES